MPSMAKQSSSEIESCEIGEIGMVAEDTWHLKIHGLLHGKHEPKSCFYYLVTPFNVQNLSLSSASMATTRVEPITCADDKQPGE